MNNIQILNHTNHESPTGCIEDLLQQAINGSIVTNPSTINVIRKNARPVMIESPTLHDDKIIQQLASHYTIPAHIIAEILANAQMIGFLAGADKQVSQDTLQAHTHKTKEELIEVFIDTFLVSGKDINDSDIRALDIFFVSLSETNVIQTLKTQGITKKDMPRGVIRQISLFDVDYNNTFQDMQQRLDFILLNIQEQDRLFGEDYATMIQENGGLPVDDIIGKETTMLSKDAYFGRISTINYEGQQIGTLMRVIPGFSPVGIDIMAGLDLPGGNQNYFATIGIQFNKINNQTIPVVHTIQLSTHNIGSTPAGEIISIKEPYDDNTVTMKQRMRIINAFTTSIYDFDGLREELIDKSHTGLPAEIFTYLDNNAKKSLQGKIELVDDHIRILAIGEERRIIKDKLIQAVIENLKNDGVTPLLVSTINYLFSHGYPQVIIQNADKNMRLQQHNQTRSEKSIVSSGDNLYTKKAMQVGGVKNQDGDFIITPQTYFAAMGNIIYGHQFLQTDTMMQSKNNIFKPSHPATTSIFDIQNNIDRSLLEIFIQSPSYRNAI